MGQRAARGAPATGTFSRGFPFVDLATRQGDAQEVFIDGVVFLFGTDAKAAFFWVFLFVQTGLGVLFLDFPNRGNDGVVALMASIARSKRTWSLPMPSSPMGNGAGAQCIGTL